MKRRILKIGAWVVGLALLGFVVSASGVVPIKASSGHWAITEWFLHFSKRRSVKTHSLGVAVPALEDPALVLRGAGHFETACRPCHGAPGFARPVVPMAMTPHPPDLGERVGQWDPEELFYIVKHGIKMTGMPAWPTQQRDDEVWAMVAFVLKLPELDAGGYEALVFGREVAAGDPPGVSALGGPEAQPRDVVDVCARCHGADGRSRGAGAFPLLAGQKLDYLRASLHAFARGERHSGMMQPVAAGLGDVTIDALARYYAALPPPPPRTDLDPALVERGAAIARHGIPEERVPSCADCHGPSDRPRRPIYPRLAGQDPSYLEVQLTLFAEGRRGGTPFVELMQEVAHDLEPDARRAVAAFYASLASDDGR